MLPLTSLCQSIPFMWLFFVTTRTIAFICAPWPCWHRRPCLTELHVKAACQSPGWRQSHRCHPSVSLSELGLVPNPSFVPSGHAGIPGNMLSEPGHQGCLPVSRSVLSSNCNSSHSQMFSPCGNTTGTLQDKISYIKSFSIFLTAHLEEIVLSRLRTPMPHIPTFYF